MTESPVIAKLLAFRTRVRRRLIAYGCCAVLFGAIAAMLGLIIVDWLFVLPSMLRGAAAIAYGIALVWGILHWIVRPIRARLHAAELASQVERHFTHLRDRLSSAVSFLLGTAEASPAMVRRVIANTEKAVEPLHFESALAARPLAIRAALLVVCIGVLNGVLLANPSWLATGLYRYLQPWGEFRWPRHVQIQPLTAHQKVAVGESATVRMSIVRGLSSTLRGEVVFRSDGERPTRRALQQDADGNFSATIDAITEDLEYWFVAGDDSTTEHPYRISVILRPAVERIVARINPPPYAPQAESWVEDLGDAPVRAPVGGDLEIELTPSKPLPPGGAVLRRPDGSLLELARDPQNARMWRTTIHVEQDQRFRAELTDADGFENRGGAEYVILAAPDSPPRVTVVEPAGAIDLTPSATIDIVARAEDDFGIAALDLDVDMLGGTGRVFPLTDRMTTTYDGSRATATATFPWNLQALDLAPGDSLLCYLVARDNYVYANINGQTTRSSPLRITIISDVEFDERIRESLSHLENRIRQALLEQTAIHDRNVGLSATVPQTGPEPATMLELANRQSRLIRRTREMADQLDVLVERIRRNVSGDQQRAEQMAGLARALRQTGVGPMTRAALVLRDGETKRDQPLLDLLEEAAGHELTARDELERLLETVSKWDGFGQLVARTRDLGERQENLRDQTAKLGRTMLGKRAENLSDEERARLTKAARVQEQLSTDVERLLRQMRQMAGNLSGHDDPGAEAIDQALRLATAQDLQRHLDDAAGAIHGNRTAAATISQKKTADALRKMVSALRQREDRALQELRKQLQNAEAQLRELIQRQQGIRDATREADLLASGPEVVADLANDQRTLARNTRLFASEMAPVRKAAAAVQLVRDAETAMYEAEGFLRQTLALEATSSQDNALDKLRDALDRFIELERQTEDEALRRTLEQIREFLSGLLEGQQNLNAEIHVLADAVEATGRMTRPEARRASRLARGQADLHEQVSTQLPDFEQAIIYRWSLERVARWMLDSRRRLSSRTVDEELKRITARIVSDLQNLIDAIDATQALPMDTQFVESQGNGGGSSGSSKNVTVPTVAELLVLKAMQADINQRTTALRDRFDTASASETQLRELATLGEDQAEVRQLTEKVIQKARQP